MTEIRVLHGTDLGQSLEISQGKLEVNAANVRQKLADAEIDAGIFPNTYNQVDPANNPYILHGEIRSQLESTEPTYEELGLAFENALTENPNINRYVLQYGSTSWAWTKYADGRWLPGTHHYQSGANGILSPQARVVNDPANPLFVDRNGQPVDISKNVSNYNLLPANFMRMVVGASATWEVHKAVPLRSLELLTDAKMAGYAFGRLKADVEFEDGTIETIDVRPYTSGWYFGDVIKQSRYVKSVRIYVDAVTLEQVGKQPTHYAFDFANKRYIHRSDPAYATATPVVNIFYIYGYYKRGIPDFYHPEDSIDITSEYTITSSIAASSSTSVANLLDNNPLTYYQSSTTANSVTFTLDKIAGTPERTPHFVELLLTPLLPLFVDDPSMNSISRVVVATSVANASAVSTSNTRDLTGLQAKLDANGNSYLALHAAFPNTYPDPTTRITVALTKTVAGNFKLACIKVYGHSPLA